MITINSRLVVGNIEYKVYQYTKWLKLFVKADVQCAMEGY